MTTPPLMGVAGAAPVMSAAGRGGASAGSMAVLPAAGSGGASIAGSGAGTSGVAGAGAAGGSSSASAGAAAVSGGKCCPDGNCLCHGDPPAMLTVAAGPYKTASKTLQTGTMYYPMDAEPPLAGVSICPGFLNTGPEMTDWGPFYASWGIVTVVTNTGAADIPDIRAGLLLGAIDELKKENMASGSPISGKMSGRYGTSGYSMGGGGTTIAAQMTPSLNSSVGLAAWGGDGSGTKVPELLLCGDADTVAPCDMSSGVYAGIPNSTPKMQVTIPGATHFDWFGPKDTADQMSGKYGLAFEKVYLEGDTRWKALLMTKLSGSRVQTNIQ